MKDQGNIVELRATSLIPQRMKLKILRAIQDMLAETWIFLAKKEAIIIADQEFAASIRARRARKKTDPSLKFEVVVTTCDTARFKRQKALRFATIEAIYSAKPPEVILACA